MAIESILAGGLLRLAPEVINILDRRNQRKHDVEMARINAENRKGEQERETEKVAIETVGEVVKSQMQLTGNKFVDGWNMLMRPIIATQWVVIMYPMFLGMEWYQLTQMDYNTIDAFLTVFGDREKAICESILTFFFVDRVFKYIGNRK